MKTDLEYLDHLIRVDYKTTTAFCKEIKMTAQNLNNIKRKAVADNGTLDEAFIRKLKGFDIDLYKYRREPTNDFVQNFSLPENMVAEPDVIYIQKERLLSMLEDQKTMLMIQIRVIESQQRTIERLTEEHQRKTA